MLPRRPRTAPTIAPMAAMARTGPTIGMLAWDDAAPAPADAAFAVTDWMAIWTRCFTICWATWAKTWPSDMVPSTRPAEGIAERLPPLLGERDGLRLLVVEALEDDGVGVLHHLVGGLVEPVLARGLELARLVALGDVPQRLLRDLLDPTLLLLGVDLLQGDQVLLVGQAQLQGRRARLDRARGERALHPVPLRLPGDDGLLDVVERLEGRDLATKGRVLRLRPTACGAGARSSDSLSMFASAWAWANSLAVPFSFSSWYFRSSSIFLLVRSASIRSLSDPPMAEMRRASASTSRVIFSWVALNSFAQASDFS